MSKVETLSPSLFSDPAMSPRSPKLPRFTFENQAMVPRLEVYTANEGQHPFKKQSGTSSSRLRQRNSPIEKPLLVSASLMSAALAMLVIGSPFHRIPPSSPAHSQLA